MGRSTMFKSLVSALVVVTALVAVTSREVRAVPPSRGGLSGGAATVTSIAIAYSHTCSVARDGNVYCFGRDFQGETGQGATGGNWGDSAGDAANIPPVALGAPAKSVAVGFWFSCALLYDGKVKCWGRNTEGQLGQGDTNNRGDGPGEMGSNLTAIDFGSNRAAVQITAGNAFACAILDDASVRCWGDNTYGQLGQGDTNNRGDGPGEMGSNLSAVNLGAGKTALSIDSDSSSNHVCAVLNDFSLKCWGLGNQGQLGLGNGNSLAAPSASAINLGTGLTAMQVGVGAYHTCALLSDGTIKCWGFNDGGQLGYGDTSFRGDTAGTTPALLPAVDLGSDDTAIGVSLGEEASCAIRSDASTVCWGKNVLAALGRSADTTLKIGDEPGEMGTNLVATGSSNAVALYFGSYSGCVATDSGALSCWGYNGNFQLGLDATTNPVTTPTTSALDGRFSAALHVKQIAAGDVFACALFFGGNVRCWGQNIDGQRGSGDNVARGLAANEIPNIPDINLGAGKYAVSISLDYYGACALFGDRSVKCWGFNSVGHLGQGDTTSRNTPVSVNVGTGLKVLALESNGGATCVVLTTRQAKCWGGNFSGRLGIGDNAWRGDGPNEMGDNLPFVRPVSGTPWTVWKMMPSGGMHACGIDTSGVAYCWGDNSSGELGRDSTTSANRPVTVSLGGRTVRDISPGSYSTCAILSDFKLLCWGKNDLGQLGVGSIGNVGDSAGEMAALLPIDLGSNASSLPLGTLALSTRDNNTCAILTTGILKCWGSNSTGQLGLGDTSLRGATSSSMGSSLPAVNIGSSVGALTVGLGTNFACVSMTNGRAKCWGYNSVGQLGQNNTIDAGSGGSSTAMSALPTIKFLNPLLTTPSPTSSSTSLTFTLTSDNSINCATVTSADLTVTNGTFVSATSSGTVACSIAVTSTISSSGTTTVTASGSFSVADTDGAVATALRSPSSVSVVVDTRTSQSLTFGATGGNLAVNATRAITASSTSPLSVTITSTTPSICTFAAGTVTALSVGSCILEANQSGDSTFSPAPPIQATVPIVKASQTISFAYSSGTLSVGGPAVAATASSTSLLPVAVVSTTTSICTWSAGQVTPVAAGSCVLRGTQAGNATYDAATQTDYTITIAKVAQTISLTYAGGAVAPGDPAIELSPTASSGLAVDLTSTTPLVCTVSANKVSPIANGDCIIEANQAGNATYAAASAVQATIQVSKTNQTITVTGAPSSVKIGADPFGLTATSSAGLAVTLESSTPELCTVSLGLVTIVATKTGTCTIVASQAGTKAISPASNVTTSITIVKGDQAPLHFSGDVSVGWLVSGGKISIAATGGSGTGALSARVVTAGTASCSVTSTDVVAATVGTCDIELVKAADDTYAAVVSAKTTLSFTMATQTVRFTNQLPAQPEVGDTISLAAVSDSAFATSPVALSVSILTRLVCSLSTNQSPATLTLKTTGTCVVRAISQGRAGLLASPAVSLTIAVGARTQSIDFAQPSSMKLGDPDRETTAKASSGLGIVFTSTTPMTCTIDSTGYLTAKSVGTCTLSADQPGDSTYAVASTVSRSFEIDATTPTAPFITSVSAGDRSIYVAFTMPGFDGGAPIVAYAVTATPDGGGTPTTAPCAASPCLLTGLTNGTSYSATVAARNPVGTGPASTPSRKVTPAGRPNAARNLVASLSGSTLTAAWNEPLSLNGGTFSRYDVTERTSGGSWPAAATYQGTAIATTKATFAAVKPQTPYDVKVVVITSNDGIELESNTAEVLATPLSAPATPAQATALDASSREIVVSWSEPVSDGGSPVTSYSVTLRGIGPCPRVEIDSATRTGRCIISDPTPGVTYTVAVAAVNAVGTGTAVVVTATAPKAPTPDAILAEPDGSILPSVPGFVRTTPIPARDTASARTRLSVDVDSESDNTAIVFVVEKSNGAVAATYTVTLREGARVASVVVPLIDPTSRVYAYARNAYGVSRNAPTDANIVRRLVGRLPKSSQKVRRLVPDLLFEAASSAINRGNRERLKEIGDKYGNSPVIIHVTGYARGGGAPKNFLTYISIRRAQAVARFLSRNGVKVPIVYSGLGDNGKIPGTPADRRVIVSIEQIAGTAIK